MGTSRVKAIPLTSFDSSTLTGGYDVFVDALEEPCFLVRIINLSTKNVIISFDGTQPHDLIPSEDSVNYNFQTNNQPRSHFSLLAKNQKIWLNGVAGSGFIYLAGYYV